MWKRLTGLLLALTLLVGLLALPAAAAETGEPVATVQALGILNGDQNGNLNLSGNVTRAQFCKMAVETCVWPLYEVVEGKYILSYQPKNKLPVEEYLRMQGRFAHMFKPGNEWMIEEVQKEVDRNWEELLKLCEM